MSAEPAGDRRLDTPVLTVDGRQLAPTLYPRIRQVRVEESVQLPDRFTLRFDDPVFELFDEGTFVPGVRVQIAFRTEAEPLVVTEGEVTTVSVEPGSAGHHELVVTGLDRGHRLARVARTRSFQNMSDAAIVIQLAGEHGLDAAVELEGETFAYVLQAAQSDWAFLRERVTCTGHDMWVSGGTLHVAPVPAAGESPTLVWKENLLGFSVRFSAVDRCDEVVVTGWDALGKRTVRGSASAGDPGTDAPAVRTIADAARRTFGRERRETGRRGIGTAAEAQAMARSLLARTSGTEAVLRGEAAGDPRLRAGSRVRVQGVGSGLSGTYRLTSVEHVYGSGSAYVTRFVSGGKDPSGVLDLLRPGAEATSAPGTTLVVGEVTNNDDPEHQGRVRVRFPTLSDQDESSWARLAAPGAGARRGLQWSPSVGDEVLVGFEYGDVHRPVVLGGLWNRTDPPPEAAPATDGEVRTRVMATGTDHRLEMVDDPGRVTLTLGDAASEVTLTEAETRVVGAQAVVVRGDTVEIRADTKLVLSAKDIEITARGEVTVAGRKIRLN